MALNFLDNLSDNDNLSENRNGLVVVGLQRVIPHLELCRHRTPQAKQARDMP